MPSTRAPMRGLGLREQLIAAYRYITGRQGAYKAVFLDAVRGEEVLQDLANFCRAGRTTVDPNSDRMSYVLEGRREVFLRIMEHLKLSPEEAFQLYTGRSPDEIDQVRGEEYGPE